MTKEQQPRNNQASAGPAVPSSIFIDLPDETQRCKRQGNPFWPLSKIPMQTVMKVDGKLDISGMTVVCLRAYLQEFGISDKVLDSHDTSFAEELFPVYYPSKEKVAASQQTPRNQEIKDFNERFQNLAYSTAKQFDLLLKERVIHLRLADIDYPRLRALFWLQEQLEEYQASNPNPREQQCIQRCSMVGASLYELLGETVYIVNKALSAEMEYESVALSQFVASGTGTEVRKQVVSLYEKQKVKMQKFKELSFSMSEARLEEQAEVIVQVEAAVESDNNNDNTPSDLSVKISECIKNLEGGNKRLLDMTITTDLAKSLQEIDALLKLGSGTSNLFSGRLKNTEIFFREILGALETIYSETSSKGEKLNAVSDFQEAVVNLHDQLEAAGPLQKNKKTQPQELISATLKHALSHLVGAVKGLIAFMKAKQMNKAPVWYAPEETEAADNKPIFRNVISQAINREASKRIGGLSDDQVNRSPYASKVGFWKPFPEAPAATSRQQPQQVITSPGPAVQQPDKKLEQALEPLSDIIVLTVPDLQRRFTPNPN